MNQEVKTVTTWLSANKISLNLNKTHISWPFKQKKKSLHDKTVAINGRENEKVKYTKFIDDELSWKYHVNRVSNKISKMTVIIA